MTSEQFTYWLQGFSELMKPGEYPTQDQWLMIQEHLRTVFKKVTPQHKPNDIVNTPYKPVDPWYPRELIPSKPMPFGIGPVICGTTMSGQNSIPTGPGPGMHKGNAIVMGSGHGTMGGGC